MVATLLTLAANGHGQIVPAVAVAAAVAARREKEQPMYGRWSRRQLSLYYYKVQVKVRKPFDTFYLWAYLILLKKCTGT